MIGTAVSRAVRLSGRLGRALDWLCRLALGLTFIYAAVGKIHDPAEFAAVIVNYRLFPAAVIGPLAIWLPWLELWAGFLILTGLSRRPAALLLGLMLVSFMLAVGFNLYRGLDFECGCFGVLGASGGGRQAGFNLLWQDGLLLLCAAFLFARPPAADSIDPLKKSAWRPLGLLVAGMPLFGVGAPDAVLNRVLTFAPSHEVRLGFGDLHPSEFGPASL